MNSPDSDSSVHLDNIQIRYGRTVAVEDVTLEIGSGEFFTLLGPSGCGKTTLLRTIAGFSRQSEGHIRIGRTAVDHIPAYRRDTGMVFQNYAIFPHLNVWDNVAYGLRARRVSKADLKARVGEALEMVDLAGFGQRLPRNLSGGQQQRVVIARAIVIRPRVMLMDEPLANLDAKLRVRLRNDVRALQQELGITTIYVTHDQEEALEISDRVAVMSGGRVLQVGTPEQIYSDPQHLFVARFVGAGTFIPALLSRDGATARLPNQLDVPTKAMDTSDRDCLVALRPEEIRIVPDGESAAFEGTISARSFLGPEVQLRVDAGVGEPLLVRVPSVACPPSAVVGSRIRLALAIQRATAFPRAQDAAELVASEANEEATRL